VAITTNHIHVSYVSELLSFSQKKLPCSYHANSGKMSQASFSFLAGTHAMNSGLPE